MELVLIGVSALPAPFQPSSWMLRDRRFMALVSWRATLLSRRNYSRLLRWERSALSSVHSWASACFKK